MIRPRPWTEDYEEGYHRGLEEGHTEADAALRAEVGRLRDMVSRYTHVGSQMEAMWEDWICPRWLKDMDQEARALLDKPEVGREGGSQ